MVFALFDPVQRCMGEPCLLREFQIRQVTPSPSDESGKLSIKISSHGPRMPENPSRMCDDVQNLPYP